MKNSFHLRWTRRRYRFLVDLLDFTHYKVGEIGVLTSLDQLGFSTLKGVRLHYATGSISLLNIKYYIYLYVYVP